MLAAGGRAGGGCSRRRSWSSLRCWLAARRRRRRCGCRAFGRVGRRAVRWRAGTVRCCGLARVAGRVGAVGSSSRAAWVSARSPAPSSCRTAEALFLFSQPSTVSGRRPVTRFWCRACSSARTSPVRPPSSSLSRARRLHRAEERERSWRWCPHAGHERKNDASGRVQVAQNGAVRVPPRIGLTSPQRAHCAHRCWHAVHHSCPVALEISQAADRPQIEQVITLADRQLGHSGPSGVRMLTGRRRAQPRQVSRLDASVLRQCGHSGLPCLSQVAGSRCMPQREQAWARDLARQLRQTQAQSRVLLSVMTRPLCGQGGRVTRPDPAAMSASIERSTEETGACAPAPVSSSGRSCSDLAESPAMPQPARTPSPPAHSGPRHQRGFRPFPARDSRNSRTPCS